MKIPIDWLKEFVKLPDEQNKLVDIFIQLGFEVENISNEVIDIEVTPNRGDVLSIFGIARDLGIILNQPLSIPQPQNKYQGKSQILDIQFQNKSLVNRYAGLILEDIKIEESPAYICQRLAKAGIRPINNIVDLTNYLMLETGQPLHAFDLDKIKNKKIILRLTGKREKIVTLDGMERELAEGNLVIENNNQIIDLVGIMGGENSEVDKNTKKVFLQAGIFDEKNIRKTAKDLHLQTEASYRYERQIDWQAAIFALQRSEELLKEMKIGKVVERFDYQNNPSEIKTIAFDWQKINQLIGTKIDEQFIKKSLLASGCLIKNNKVIIPSHRHDLNNWQDLAEEVARIYGYNRLNQVIIEKVKPVENKDYWTIANLKQKLVSDGYSEVRTYSFLSKKEIAAWSQMANAIYIPNPISAELECLRTSLTPLLIKTFSRNPWDTTTKIFEIGNVFNPQEEMHFAVAGWKKLNIKGEKILAVTDELAKLYKIRRPIYYFETTLKEAIKIFQPLTAKSIIDELRRFKYQKISSQYPTVRDISFIIDKEISLATIESEIYQADKNILIIELFDQFESEKIGKDKISYAFHIIFEGNNLTENDKTMKQIEKILKEKYQGRIR